MRTVETINAIIMALFFLCYSYQFVYLAIGLFAKPKKTESPATRHRIAVLIAARNEEAVIGQLLDSVRAQNYPAELLADEHGWSSSVPNLSGKLRRGSLRYTEAVELADVLGYDLVWQKCREVR